MIFWYTDNEISQRFAEAFRANGIETDHVSEFHRLYCKSNEMEGSQHIFYGIHRGCGSAMRICHGGWAADYYYIDNGYFDARYVDAKMVKDLGGTYRVVKNDMIQAYEGLPSKEPLLTVTFCVLPPSPYSAYFYDTTPEDWINEQYTTLSRLGHKMFLRSKDSDKSLDEDLNNCDAVLAFNSMAVMRAVELGKAVYTTHGVFRNSHLLTSHLPFYDIEDVRSFYADKQFTLDDIGEGKWMN